MCARCGSFCSEMGSEMECHQGSRILGRLVEDLLIFQSGLSFVLLFFFFFPPHSQCQSRKLGLDLITALWNVLDQHNFVCIPLVCCCIGIAAVCPTEMIGKYITHCTVKAKVLNLLIISF